MPELLKTKMKDNKKIIGTMIQDFPNPILIDLLNECEIDFIVLDQEHGPSNFYDIQNLVLTAKSLDIAVLIRATKISYEYIAKLLDMGCDGLMIPHVETIEQVKNIVKWSKYPPIGNRSYGMRKNLSKWYNGESSSDYIKKANEKIVIFIQIESPESSENAEEFLSEPEIDGVIMGPADFTMNLGKIGQYEDGEFIEHAEKILNLCKKNGKYFGIHLSDFNMLKDWKKKGMNILMYSNIKGIIKERVIEIVSNLKENAPKQNNKDLY